MFNVKLIGRSNDDSTNQEDSEKMDYYAILSTIINNKWGV